MLLSVAVRVGAFVVLQVGHSLCVQVANQATHGVLAVPTTSTTAATTLLCTCPSARRAAAAPAELAVALLVLVTVALSVELPLPGVVGPLLPLLGDVPQHAGRVVVVAQVGTGLLAH
jgi:hypothetical protein